MGRSYQAVASTPKIKHGPPGMLEACSRPLSFGASRSLSDLVFFVDTLCFLYLFFFLSLFFSSCFSFFFFFPSFFCLLSWQVFLRTREQITDIICMALAGRASEQVHFGDVSSFIHSYRN